MLFVCLTFLVSIVTPLGVDAKRRCLTSGSLLIKLQNSYTATVKFANGTFIYKIDLISRPDFLFGTFNYNVSVVGLDGKSTQIATNFQGRLRYETIFLPLPGASTCLTNAGTILPSGSLSCIAVGDPARQMLGNCTQLFSVGDVIGSVLAASSIASLTLLPN